MFCCPSGAKVSWSARAAAEGDDDDFSLPERSCSPYQWAGTHERAAKCQPGAVAEKVPSGSAEELNNVVI